MSVVKEWPCGIHDLVYHAVRAGCPACALQRKIEEVVQERDDLQAEVVTLRQGLNRVKSISDLGFVMKRATKLLDERDQAFLDRVIRRWRDLKDIDLGITEDRRGFITNDELHTCSSAGGIAIAASLLEATAAYGKAIAMSMLQRAVLQETADA